MAESADSPFVLPRVCIDMGEMNAAQIGERTESARSWVHAFAQPLQATAIEMTADGVRRSFDVFELRDLGLWLMHNRFVSVLAAVDVQPEPGRGWAIDHPCVELAVPHHLQTWGPHVPSSHDLNAELIDERWGDVSSRARQYADRFKPETVAQVLFNYWD